MSLSERLRKIEQRLTELERAAQDLAEAQAQIVDAMDTDDDQEPPVMDLDGNQYGGERDGSQPL